MILIAYNTWKRYQGKKVREEGAEIDSEGKSLKTETSSNGILPKSR